MNGNNCGMTCYQRGNSIPACTTAWVCAEVPEAMLVSAHAASNWSDGLMISHTRQIHIRIW